MRSSPDNSSTSTRWSSSFMASAPILAAHFGLSDLDAALIADDAAVLHSLIFSAEAFPISNRSENLRAEQPVSLGFERAIVDRLGLGDLAVRPRENLLRRS